MSARLLGAYLSLRNKMEKITVNNGAHQLITEAIVSGNSRSA